jgi:hypothetical protein
LLSFNALLNHVYSVFSKLFIFVCVVAVC